MGFNHSVGLPVVVVNNSMGLLTVGVSNSVEVADCVCDY